MDVATIFFIGTSVHFSYLECLSKLAKMFPKMSNSSTVKWTIEVVTHVCLICYMQWSLVIYNGPLLHTMVPRYTKWSLIIYSGPSLQRGYFSWPLWFTGFLSALCTLLLLCMSAHYIQRRDWWGTVDHCQSISMSRLLYTRARSAYLIYVSVR